MSVKEAKFKLLSATVNGHAESIATTLDDLILAARAELPCYRHWSSGPKTDGSFTSNGPCPCPVHAARAGLAACKVAV